MSKLEWEVAVFVERGKRGWKFRAYTRVYNREWDGCNIVHVRASNGTEAKNKAIGHIKARMNLNSQIPPSNVAICRE